MIDAQDLSRAEHCLRLPGLLREYEPFRLPVREAIKQRFEVGIRTLTDADMPERCREEFLAEAAGRGFEYPEKAEVYVLANDYASWLEGALHLAQEQPYNLGPLGLVDLGGTSIRLSGYSDRAGAAHFFRVTPAFDGYRLHWPELLAFSLGNYPRAVVHRYRLPQSREGRLPSPLCLAYRHPMTGRLRVARRDKEKVSFSKTCKRVARWEETDIDWPEWRTGIDLDQAMSLCYDEVTFENELTSAEAREIRKDADAMLSAIEKKQPRKREGCHGCMMNLYCHGTARDREDYVRIEQKDLQRV
jgi:hypothetical protein